MSILEAKHGEIASLCMLYGVERLQVFGSVLRPDWDERSSDFDFFAKFGIPPQGVNLFDQQFGFQVDLERLLGYPVDVVDLGVVKKPIFRDIEAQETYAA